jgi:hypothetical protein
MPEILVPIVLFVMIPITAIGVPIARAYARRLDRGSNRGASPEVERRLERMEQAIDAIAVEVERIAEGQRFTTKLLTGRAPEGTAVAATGGRAEQTSA